MLALQTLEDTHPDIELWLDSLPMTFNRWKDGIVSRYEKNRAGSLGANIASFFNPDRVEQGMVKGCTSNPRLVWEEVESAPEFWVPKTQSIIKNHSGMHTRDIYLILYKHIFEINAEIMLPLWQLTDAKYGWISAQIPPIYSFDKDKIIELALELTAISPNIMIKVLGNKEGYQIIEQLTGLGISTNCTLSFNVPQFLSCTKAVDRGLQHTNKNGVDITKWRSVITYMMGRFGTDPAMQKQSNNRNIPLSRLDIRWAEIAIYKKMYRLLKEQHHPSKLLICSLKIDSIDGVQQCMHIERSCGSGCIYTIPTSFLDGLLKMKETMRLDDKSFNDEIPDEVFNKLMALPYFRRSHLEEGIRSDEFMMLPTFVNCLQEFYAAYNKMNDFIEICRR